MLASKLTIINLRYTGTFRKVTVLNSWIFVKVGRQLLRDRRKSLVSMIIQNDREDEGGDEGDEGEPKDRTRE